ncbi:MAG: hypothetical protein EOP53_01405 [Sphingobacteriales bacterium]|nr:MAG: hypothetical protein EOP53_01405 [Sphingobacteriales bacterium]
MKTYIKRNAGYISLKKVALLALPLALFLNSCKKDPVTPSTPKPEPQKDAVVLESIKMKTILEDRISDPNIPDYLVNQSISVSAELTLKSGVVIGFAQDARLDINSNGILIAKGEANKKIRFIGQVAQKGYWSGIAMYSNSSANEFTYTEILHAGSKPMFDNIRSAVSMFEGSRLNVKNTTVSLSGGYGMYFRNSALLLNFANNKFTENKEAPMLMTAANVPQLDAATTFTGNNGRNVIEVMQSYIDGAEEIVWPAFTDGTGYRLNGTITTRTGWKLQPGTTIEVVENEFINIEKGYLNAVGTTEKKINFQGVVKAPGSWKGIVIYSRSAYNQMENVKISHAGGIRLISTTKASIALFGPNMSNLSLKNSEISQSGGYGIHLYGKNAEVNADVTTSNSFTNNAADPIFAEE